MAELQFFVAYIRLKKSVFSLYSEILEVKIRDTLWDTSTENFEENKGHQEWTIPSVPY